MLSCYINFNCDNVPAVILGVPSDKLGPIMLDFRGVSRGSRSGVYLTDKK